MACVPLQVFRSEASAHGCDHLRQLKLAQPEVAESYRTICRYALAWRNSALYLRASDPFPQPNPPQPASSNKRKQHPASAKEMQLEKPKCFPVPICVTCKEARGRIHACLLCTFLGCWRHNQEHEQSQHHEIAIHLDTGATFCFECNKYVYDFELDAILRFEKLRTRDTLVDQSVKNAKRVKYNEPTLSLADADAIRDHSTLHKCTGLRGLYNLGNTCYMNCILQVLVHNPIVRSFFLSDGHNSQNCPSKMNGFCLACDLDLIFSEFYKGETKPFAPAQLVQTIWSVSVQFAQYRMQDAHELFIALLDGIHRHSQGTTENCTCIAHTTFAGELQSVITCASCGKASMKEDPFFDLSLDLHAASSSSATTAVSLDTLQPPPTGIKDVKSSPNKKQNAAAKVPKSLCNFLTECLEGFTMPEKVEGFKCHGCEEIVKESSKQFYLAKLPIVLSLHLKRFIQTEKGTWNKLEQFISFPMTLDMGPYLALNASGAKPSSAFMEGFTPHEYVLHGVVTHSGTISSGHYIVFVKHRGEWYKIDDLKVNRTSNLEVLRQNAYMLYYVRRHLDYEYRMNA